MRVAICSPLLLALAVGSTAATPTWSAEPSLGAAVKAADGRYLEAPEIGLEDASPKIVVGGGEEGLPPLEEEISQGPLRVTLTYVEEEPREEEPASPSEGSAEDEGAAAEVGPDEVSPDELAEDVPEEAILPDEVGIGEQVWRAPVVTIYFDDPNSPAPVDSAEDASASDGATADNATADDETGEVAEGDSEAAAEPQPAGPRVVAKLQGDSAGFADPPVSVQIAELDPNNPYPEVVVSFYTGGAHCCSQTSVVTSDADGSEWTTIDVGEFDGGPMLAIDLDRDGTYEFETRDNAFLYAFACYACSEAPLQVLALKDGKIEDVSDDPRFKPAHAAWLKNMIVGVPEEDVNGFLAGYVGEKIRLGEGRQAWELMLKYYDRASDWGLDICEHDVDENGECLGETTRLTFPEALERMLNENGYKIGM